MRLVILLVSVKIPYHHIVFTENQFHECENINVLIDEDPHYANELF
jgi:hypothetical protein